MTGVPYTFGTATTAIPLSELDICFATPVTIGSASVALGNAITDLPGLTTIGVGAGSASAPSVTVRDSNTGLYSTATKILSVAVNGLNLAEFRNVSSNDVGFGVHFAGAVVRSDTAIAFDNNINVTTRMYPASGDGYNVRNTVAQFGFDNSTNYSICAGGAIGASGADYAEYYRKSETCGPIAKGQLVGIDADGLITDKFSLALDFLFKSTLPNLVGGDNFGSAEQLGLSTPMPPRYPEETGDVEVDAAAASKYETDRAQYQQQKDELAVAYEAARVNHDRLAKCGKIPAILSGTFAAGDYVLAAEGPGDSIAATVADRAGARIEDKISAVGRVRIASPSLEQWKELLGVNYQFDTATPGFNINPAWNAIVDV